MKSKSTLKNYEVAFNQFLKYNSLYENDIQNIEPKKLADLIDKTFENHNGKGNTKLTKISSVKSYIETHYKIEIPKSIIRKDYSREILRKTNKKLITYEEMDLLIKHFETVHNEAEQLDKITTLRNLIMIKLLAGTGQRISDILNMSIETAKKTLLHIKQIKTGKDVTIENPCLSEILKYIAVTKLSDSDFLFASGLTRKPLSYQQAENIIRYESKSVFKKSISSHYFRSYVVSRLIALGNHPNDIMAVTGHADTRMVDYYNKTPGKIIGLTKLLMAG